MLSSFHICTYSLAQRWATFLSPGTEKELWFLSQVTPTTLAMVHIILIPSNIFPLGAWQIGGRALFLVGMCHADFPKVGVLGVKILKFCILRAEIYAQNKAEMQNFSKNWKCEIHERRINGKLAGIGAPNGLIKGGHNRSTFAYHLPIQW